MTHTAFQKIHPFCINTTRDFDLEKQFFNFFATALLFYFLLLWNFNTQAQQLQQCAPLFIIGSTFTFNSNIYAQKLFNVKNFLHVKIIFLASRWISIHSIIVALSTRYFLFFAASILVIAHFLKMLFTLLI